MKLVIISDTHGLHDKVGVPSGDILIHSGDFSNRGKCSELISFLNWYEQHDFKHKILIAGNHDWICEQNHSLVQQECIDRGIHYLNDSGVEIEGINFWGSPVTPFFFNWAFNRLRGNDIKKHWDLIPDNTNILITHGPPNGFLDRVALRGSTNFGQNVGCEELSKKIDKLPELKMHVFGHIHSEYGQIIKNGVHYINASVCDDRYRPIKSPHVVDYD